jgi:hypothetical protein
MPLRTVFAMNNELEQIFDRTPDDEPRSKLEPYRELILRWRRQGKTYRRICTLLLENCNISIGKSALNEFVHRRSRPRKGGSTVEEACPVPPVMPEGFGGKAQHSTEEIAAWRDAARSANQQPLVHVKPTDRVFTYDPSKPITNKKL